MPSLFDLIYKNRESRHDNVRWSLLAWLFNFDEKFGENLKALSSVYVAVVLTLKYLLQVIEFRIIQKNCIILLKLTFLVASHQHLGS